MNDDALQSQFARWQRRALIVGAVAAVLSLIGAFFDHAQFFRSYLFAWLFWSGLSFGALVIVMMQILTRRNVGPRRARPGDRRLPHAPAMALLFLPVLLGLHDIYGWSQWLRGETSGYHHKAQYLNVAILHRPRRVLFRGHLRLAALLRRWSLALGDRSACRCASPRSPPAASSPTCFA